jgi:hypothetical protein
MSTTTTTEVRLEYCDLSALDVAWQPREAAPAEPRPEARFTPNAAASVGGGVALAFTGRSHGSALCIDFAEFVGTDH